MNIDRLSICSEVLGAMAANFAAMPEDRKNAVTAGLHCVMAQSYVVELARHLADGMEPYDAMEATAKGTMAIPESAATVFAILTAKPKE
ncbi:MAG: hypothetical protein JNM97_22380 [Rhodoferax sp.]|nr:hypothetical protein [Rhodoferax sp.]